MGKIASSACTADITKFAEPDLQGCSQSWSRPINRILTWRATKEHRALTEPTDGVQFGLHFWSPKTLVPESWMLGRINQSVQIN